MTMISPGGTLARESWFDLLDQRRFTVGSTRWTAQVAGVHVAGFDTWIQLEFAEDERRSMLLHLTPGTGVGAAVEAIRSSLQRRLASLD
ncbi:MAG: hypothetical protein ACRD3G_19950 [Vicinamibacterales bacterium]